MYLKEFYKNDPHFTNTKVVYNLYNDGFNTNWDARLSEKLKFDGFSDEIVEAFKSTSHADIVRNSIKYADGLIVMNEALDAPMREVFEEATCNKLDYVAEEHP